MREAARGTIGTLIHDGAAAPPVGQEPPAAQPRLAPSAASARSETHIGTPPPCVATASAANAAKTLLAFMRSIYYRTSNVSVAHFDS